MITPQYAQRGRMRAESGVGGPVGRGEYLDAGDLGERFHAVGAGVGRDAEARFITGTLNAHAARGLVLTGIAAVMSHMGKRGGPARALALSAERRTEIAKLGAKARIAKAGQRST